MATLNTLRNVVGDTGSTAANSTITFATTASATITIDSTANNRKLSVGDVLVVTGGLGASGYTVGQELTLTTVTYSGATSVVNTAAAGVAAAVTATLKNADTDKIASTGGNTNDSTFTDIVTREWNAITINAGATKTLITAAALGDATECQVLFVLDSVTTTAGVAAPTATFQLELTDGTEIAVLANLCAGDIFYSSQLTTTFYNLGTTTATVGDLVLKNTTAVNYKPTFRLVIGTKA